MTSHTFFELQRVRAQTAASTSAEVVRRRQFARATSNPLAPVVEPYQQHRPEFCTASPVDPIKRAYENLGILYE